MPRWRLPESSPASPLALELDHPAPSPLALEHDHSAPSPLALEHDHRDLPGGLALILVVRRPALGHHLPQLGLLFRRGRPGVGLEAIAPDLNLDLRVFSQV